LGRCVVKPPAPALKSPSKSSPFSNIRDLQSAAKLVAGAGAPNGGILIDIWQGLYGVEIVSDAQRAMPLEEAAALSFQAASRQFE
jgi:hypothetical protein